MWSAPVSSASESFLDSFESFDGLPIPLHWVLQQICYLIGSSLDWTPHWQPLLELVTCPFPLAFCKCNFPPYDFQLINVLQYWWVGASPYPSLLLLWCLVSQPTLGGSLASTSSVSYCHSPVAYTYTISFQVYEHTHVSHFYRLITHTFFICRGWQLIDKQPFILCQINPSYTI